MPWQALLYVALIVYATLLPILSQVVEETPSCSLTPYSAGNGSCNCGERKKNP